jgi:hypothetical protein
LEARARRSFSKASFVWLGWAGEGLCLLLFLVVVLGLLEEEAGEDGLGAIVAWVTAQ